MNEIHWRTRRIHDELETRIHANNAIDAKLYVKLIFGPQKYQEIQIIEEKIKCDKYKLFEKSNDNYTILKEYEHIEREYNEKYDDDEVFNTIIWDDTFEITKTQKN